MPSTAETKDCKTDQPLSDPLLFKVQRDDQYGDFSDFVQGVAESMRTEFTYSNYCKPEDLDSLKEVISLICQENLTSFFDRLLRWGSNTYLESEDKSLESTTDLAAIENNYYELIEKILKSEYDSLELNLNELSMMQCLEKLILSKIGLSVLSAQLEKILKRTRKSLRRPHSREPLTVRLGDTGLGQRYKVVLASGSMCGKKSEVRKPRYTPVEKYPYTKPQSTTHADPTQDYLPEPFGFDQPRKDTLVGIRFSLRDALTYRIFLYDAGTFGRHYDSWCEDEARVWIEQKKAHGMLHDDFDSLVKKGLKLPKGRCNEVMARFKVSLDGSFQFVIFSDNLHSRLLAQARAIAMKKAIEHVTKREINPFPISFYPQLTYYGECAQNEDIKMAGREHYGLWLYIKYHENGFKDVPDDGWQKLIPVLQRLCKTSLRGLDFGTADLSGTDLSGLDLEGANLSQAKLNDVKYDESTCFQDVRLNATQLKHFWDKNKLQLERFYPRNVRLGAFVLSTRFNFHDCNWDGYDLTGIDFNNIENLDEAAFTGAILDSKQIKVLIDKAINLEGVIVSPDADLTGIDFSRVSLKNVNFQNATLSAQQFYYVLGVEGIKGVNVSQTTLNDVIEIIQDKTKDLESPFSGMLFGQNSFKELEKKKINNLSGIRFTDNTDLGGIDFSGFNLKDVSFEGVKIDYSTQVINILKAGGQIPRADLRDINLDSLALENLQTLSCQCRGARLNANQVKMMSKKGVKNFSGLDLTSLNLTGVDFQGVDLCGTVLNLSTLDNADLRGTDLTATELEGVSVNGAKFNGTKCRASGLSQLIKKNTEKNFDGIILKDELMSTDFEGLSLRGADFTESANICDCSFIKTDLTGANFSKSTVEQCKFDDTNLTEANFSWADIVDTEFCDSILNLSDFSEAFLISPGRTFCNNCSFVGTNMQEIKKCSYKWSRHSWLYFKLDCDFLLEQILTRLSELKSAIGIDNVANLKSCIQEMYKIDPQEAMNLVVVSEKLILAKNDNDRKKAGEALKGALARALQNSSQWCNGSFAGLFHGTFNNNTKDGQTLAGNVQDYCKPPTIGLMTRVW